MISRSARSIRSSSWPVLDGAPGGQQRLDARLADVRLVERHLVAERGLLDRADPLVEAPRPSASGPSSLEQPIGVHQVDERRRDRPVLGLAPLEQHVRPRGDRDARGDVEAARRRRRRARACARRRAAPRAGAPRSLAGPTQRRIEARGERGADARSRRRRRSPPSCSVSVIAGPAISSSRWTLPVMKKWNVPGRDPDRHPQRSSVPPADAGAARRGRSSAASPTRRGRRAARGRGPSKSRSRASPPHLSRPAPQSYASSSSAVNTPSSVSRISSAPILPFGAPAAR